MADASKREKFFLGLSGTLYAAGFFLGAAPDLTRARFFLPTGLLVLSLMNLRLRSKVLAWGIFTFSFVLFMIVFGPWVVGMRAFARADTVKFARTMALYLSLAVAALYQLRATRGERPQ